MGDIKTEIINTKEQIGDLVDWLVFRHAPPVPSSPTMYIDLEGVSLDHGGSLPILTLMIDTGIPTRRVYLFDVHSLGESAFNTAGVKGKTLKDILQDENIPKVLFDVRNDSGALFTYFGVRLQGVEDIQVMENASRRTTGSRTFFRGLAKSFEKNAVLSNTDLANWKMAKEKAKRLFMNEHGGSHDVFHQRPIPEGIISYCVSDVQYLPELWARFANKPNGWRDLVKEEAKKRVAASQKPEYQPFGLDKRLSSWSEDQNKSLNQWNYVPPSHDHFDGNCPGAEWSDGQDANDYEDWVEVEW